MGDQTALTLVPGDDPRVAGAFARILADLGSPESVRAYREEWQRYVRFLAGRGVAALAASTLDVQTYLLGMRAAKKRQSTRARALAVIRAVYAALAREGVLLGANPAREARNPKGDSEELRTPWLTESELEAFLEPVPEEGFAAQRDYLISMTLAMTGLRRAEVARIALNDFEPRPDGDKWFLRVRVKGSKYGRVEIVAPLAEQLHAWANALGITTGALFRRSPVGTQAVGVGTVRNAVKRQAARAGITDDTKYTPHAFRRSLATIAKQKGVPEEVIQRGLLHSKIDTTRRYMKLADEPEAPANAMVKLLPSRFRK
jgi:integrase